MLIGVGSKMKIQVPLKSEKDNGYLSCRTMYIFYHIALISSYNQRKMFQTKFVQKMNTHILYSVIFFFFENGALYEIM